MELFAILWENETIKESDWFKSPDCAISGITLFDGRVVEGIVWRESDSQEYYDTFLTVDLPPGTIGMELKLWWVEQQEPAEPSIRLRHSCDLDMLSDCPACTSDLIVLTEGGAA
jgi:hypothetical protein